MKSSHPLSFLSRSACISVHGHAAGCKPLVIKSQSVDLCVTAKFAVAAVFGRGWHQSGADLCAQPQGDVQDCQIPSGGGHEER